MEALKSGQMTTKQLEETAVAFQTALECGYMTFVAFSLSPFPKFGTARQLISFFEKYHEAGMKDGYYFPEYRYGDDDFEPVDLDVLDSDAVTLNNFFNGDGFVIPMKPAGLINPDHMHYMSVKIGAYYMLFMFFDG